MDDDEPLAQALRHGTPAVDDTSARVARMRAARKLFGRADAVRVGRYELEEQLGAGGGGVVFVASDPELSRKVALKLVTTRKRDRVLAEAHALARLAHPNVVPIFDVGAHDEQIYLVMELVDGLTLRAWIEQAPRTVREIVAVYRGAGAGLAAAHRAGFVHRDFKPDNALIGDGRVRVVDFGLAHVEGDVVAGVGTPRYMPPEQAAGGAITPAADQYAFCASLREAILVRGALPRWIDEILQRGLDPEPARRFPSMTAVVDALGRDPATRWRRRAAVAGALAVGAAAFVIGRAQGDELPPCDGGKAELAAVWSEPARGAALARLDGLGAYGREVRPQLATQLDGYARGWTAGHLEACQVHRRGAQSDVVFDRRMRCLDGARAALGATVDLLRSAAPEQVSGVVTAASELPVLARCADAALVGEAVAPPAPPQHAAVAAVERELAAREVDVRGGKANVPLDTLIDRARAIGYAPLIARALRLRGVAAILGGRRDDAVAPLDEATLLALEVNDDELAVEAFARRAWADGTGGKQPERALDGLPLVDAIAKRPPREARGIRALLENNVGGVELSIGRRDRARAAFERALAEQSEVRGPAAVELAQVPANLALAVDDPTRRAALFAQAIANLTALVGPNHPLTLNNRIIAANRDDDPRSAEAALASACETVIALHPDRATMIDDCAFELGWFALDRGDRVAAERWFARVVASPGDSRTDELAGLAGAHLALLAGDTSAAARFAAVRDQIGPMWRIGSLLGFSIVDEPWWVHATAIEADLGRALALRDHALLARVRDDLARLVADHPNASRARRLARIDRELRAGSP